MRQGMTFLFLLTFAPGIFAAEIRGISLPAKNSGHGLWIAGVWVEKATIYGCREKLEGIIGGTLSEKALVQDPTCEILLVKPEQYLSVVNSLPAGIIPERISAYTCDITVIDLTPTDFSNVFAHINTQHSLLSGGGGNGGGGNGGGGNGGGEEITPPKGPDDRAPGSDRGYPETKKCELNGGICLNEDGASFSAGCEGYGQIQFSTSGDVGLTIGGKPVGITINSQ